MTAVYDALIPISRLFYDDAGPHIVGVSPADRDFGGTTLVDREPQPPAARYTPARGRELHELLGTSIAQLGGVSGSTRRTPAPAPAVPIESLLYRGRAALDRALEIRAASRNSGHAPDTQTIEELLDLIGLAAED
jgi:hypothetical protein